MPSASGSAAVCFDSRCRGPSTSIGPEDGAIGRAARRVRLLCLRSGVISSIAAGHIDLTGTWARGSSFRVLTTLGSSLFGSATALTVSVFVCIGNRQRPGCRSRSRRRSQVLCRYCRWLDLLSDKLQAFCVVREALRASRKFTSGSGNHARDLRLLISPKLSASMAMALTDIVSLIGNRSSELVVRRSTSAPAGAVRLTSWACPDLAASAAAAAACWRAPGIQEALRGAAVPITPMATALPTTAAAQVQHFRRSGQLGANPCVDIITCLASLLAGAMRL